MASVRRADLCSVLFGFRGQVGVCPGAGTASVPVWAGRGTRTWLRAQGWLCKYVVKVARLKMQPELGPPRVLSSHVGVGGPPSHFDFAENDEKLDLSFSSWSCVMCIEGKQSHYQVSLRIWRNNEPWFVLFISCYAALSQESAKPPKLTSRGSPDITSRPNQNKSLLDSLHLMLRVCVCIRQRGREHICVQLI